MSSALASNDRSFRPAWAAEWPATSWAAAVSEAGGLGTLGMLGAAHLRGELAAARRLTGAPLAINLLLPFAGREH